MSKPITARFDLTGKTFGRLLVEAFAGSTKRGSGSLRRTWSCRCICGNVKVVVGDYLRDGTTRSCGCLEAENRRTMGTSHGGRRRPEYKVWEAMKHRCQNPANKKFADYGGRGIVVCDRWQGFASFFEDMGPRPTPRHSIDRVDNNRGYEPSNCRWATASEQRANRRPVDYAATSVKGADHHMAKLTDADVVAIRREHASGTGYAALAKAYSVKPNSIWRICARRTWRHVA